MPACRRGRQTTQFPSENTGASWMPNQSKPFSCTAICFDVPQPDFKPSCRKSLEEIQLVIVSLNMQWRYRSFNRKQFNNRDRYSYSPPHPDLGSVLLFLIQIPVVLAGICCLNTGKYSTLKTKFPHVPIVSRPVSCPRH